MRNSSPAGEYSVKTPALASDDPPDSPAWQLRFIVPALLSAEAVCVSVSPPFHVQGASL